MHTSKNNRGDQRPKVIAIMGPTASGKSALAMQVAEQYDGEIVSVDSALIYRGLNIGAAKPTLAEQQRIPHHLLDLRDPWQSYSAGDFVQDALAAIEDIVSRGKLPVLAGGTSLYFKALLKGLATMPSADPQLRKQLNARGKEEGWHVLHAELAKVDPVAANKIRVSDPQRIQRALEVYHLSGIPISEWQQKKSDYRFPYNTLKLIICPEFRGTLHARIAGRFDVMLEQGFLSEMIELRTLDALKQHAEPLALPALRTVGYRQAWNYLDDDGNMQDINRFIEFRNQAVAATRQLAKRQLTWLRSELDARWFDPAIQSSVLNTALSDFIN